MNEVNILFARASQDVIVPSKIEENAAFDVYAYFEENYRVFSKHETHMIPTGFYTAFSSEYVAILKERGSTGTKGIEQRAGVIDSGYRGEWLVPLTNGTSKTMIIAKDGTIIEENDLLFDAVTGEKLGHKDNFIIYPYSKAICQCLMVRVPKVTFEEISVEELKAIPSVRGEGRLGSSGK